MLNRLLLFTTLLLISSTVIAQTSSISGVVTDTKDIPLPFSTISLIGTTWGVTADEEGKFLLEGLSAGEYTISVSYLGYETIKKRVEISPNTKVQMGFRLRESTSIMNEVVVTGTMQQVSRLESPVPVEVYNPVFFKKNPTPNIFEALQNVNGVRPQLNCQVCNTGDIHINGLEGPYTMVLIDGMPIVSSLATVYGLSGIPNSIIERIEIIKGPSSSLYGSEAIGGVINVITKKPDRAPLFFANMTSTSWEEINTDLALKLNLNDNVSVLTGVNFFHYDNPIDNNNDGFTDVTIQQRVSVFQKWNINRKDHKLFTIAGRYYWEDRWGGQTNWSKAFYGGEEIYGEAINTKRIELTGQYEVPKIEDMILSLSYNRHQQNSVYGATPFDADQHIGFGQLTWSKAWSKHQFLFGSALRYTFYDDNTPATRDNNTESNKPSHTWIPGIFVQDELDLNSWNKILFGVRYDYNNLHGSIFTPRFAYKLLFGQNNIFRVNAGTGFRVVNLFTEEHAALTGSREVVISETLNPEKSYNLNLNYIKKFYTENGGNIGLEATAFYTYFRNAILPDYETNANQIIYKNLNGFAVTKGLSLNANMNLPNGLSMLIGATFLDVSKTEDGIKSSQLLTERFSTTWSLSYKFLKNKWAVDYTGNLYSPMQLPLLSELDPRSANSPWWSIQNIQVTYAGIKNFEIYGGVKNLLDWTPWKYEKHALIARSFDPFDKNVSFDENGNVLATESNPYALTFDPSYVYAPNQGIRLFLGVRYTLL